MTGMNIIELLDQVHMRADIPAFKAGDTVRVHVRIKEGEKERVQVFEGICIARHNDGVRSTFTVRKLSYGIGVERIFPVHSPRIERVELVQEGRVRRSKLYYLRSRRGKAARVRAIRRF